MKLIKNIWGACINNIGKTLIAGVGALASAGMLALVYSRLQVSTPAELWVVILEAIRDHRLGISLAVALLVIAYGLSRRVADSFKLLAWYAKQQNQPLPSAWWWASMRMLDLGGFRILSRKRLFQSVRLFIEYQILMPPAEKDKADETAMEAYLKEIKTFIKEYHREQAEPQGNRGAAAVPFAEQLRVENCFAFSTDEKRSAMLHYFQFLDGFSGINDRFLIKAKVAKGYLAPLHLVDGMLAQFEDTWATVIRAYDKELNNTGRIPAPQRIFGGAELRRQQLFVLDCWLQWGPSIPICGCDNWNRVGMVPLQYGFGDENNSMLLVPLHDRGREYPDYSFVLGAMRKASLAVPFALTVRPAFIPLGGVDGMRCEVAKGLLNQLGRAQWNMVGRTTEGTIVLDYIAVDELIDLTVQGFDKRVEDSQKHKHDYYSAYVWAMFVLCWRNYQGVALQNPSEEQNKLCQIIGIAAGQPVFPAEEAPNAPPPFLGLPQNPMPWFGMFPFFVHGNIADDATYACSKKQLASKALSCIESMLSEEVEVTTPDGGQTLKMPLHKLVEFRYASAVDHSGCSDFRKQKLDENLKSSNFIHEYFEESLSDGGKFSALKRNVVIEVNPDNGETNWPNHRETYIACKLPGLIAKFYDHCKESNDTKP